MILTPGMASGIDGEVILRPVSPIERPGVVPARAGPDGNGMQGPRHVGPHHLRQRHPVSAATRGGR
jgi:hypothetical protein